MIIPTSVQAIRLLNEPEPKRHRNVIATGKIWFKMGTKGSQMNNEREGPQKQLNEKPSFKRTKKVVFEGIVLGNSGLERDGTLTNYESTKLTTTHHHRTAPQGNAEM